MENTSKHINTKHKIKQLGSKAKFNEIIENSMLSDTEKEMMNLYYIQRKDINYIADILGYSRSGILRMHKRILNSIETLL